MFTRGHHSKAGRLASLRVAPKSLSCAEAAWLDSATLMLVPVLRHNCYSTGRSDTVGYSVASAPPRNSVRHVHFLATPEKEGFMFLHIPTDARGEIKSSRRTRRPCGPSTESPNPHGIPLSPEAATLLARSQNYRFTDGEVTVHYVYCVLYCLHPDTFWNCLWKDGARVSHSVSVGAAPRGGRAERGIKGRCGCG